jgi:hypothetical protein
MNPDCCGTKTAAEEARRHRRWGRVLHGDGSIVGFVEGEVRCDDSCLWRQDTSLKLVIVSWIARSSSMQHLLIGQVALTVFLIGFERLSNVTMTHGL